MTKPVAYLVDVAEWQSQYAVLDADDAQLVDDCTNHGAVVTPLYAAPVAQPEPAWMPIATAPMDGIAMFVVRGFDITNEKAHVRNYTTDPYCVWLGDDGGWVRWPHSFPPTHWLSLPAALQPSRKPLTDEKIQTLLLGGVRLPAGWKAFARAVERAHGIVND